MIMICRVRIVHMWQYSDDSDKLHDVERDKKVPRSKASGYIQGVRTAES